MAQDELTRLQTSLANYQAKNTSGQYSNTVANLQGKIDALNIPSKGSSNGPSYTGDPTITPTADNNYGGTGVSSGMPSGVVTPASSALPNYGVGISGPIGVTPKVTSAGIGAGGIGTGGTGTGVVTGGTTRAVAPNVVTPPAIVPTVPTVPTAPSAPNVALRDVATGAGMTVGNVGSVPTINGVQIDPAKAGLQLINGQWQGQASQIGAALGNPIGLREGLEATGRTVSYDPNTGQIKVNRIPVDTSKMVNIDGRYYTTPESINDIVMRTGGAVPLGSEYAQPKQEGVLKKPTGEEPIDNSLQTRLDEEMRKNQELQKIADELAKIKIPEEDFAKRQQLITDLQAKKGLYDADIYAVLQKTFEGFSYNPEKDPLLQSAIKYANRSMMEEMNKRGILNSSITVDNERYLYEDLMPKYQDMAFQKYNQELSNNFKKIEVMQSLTNEDYDRYYKFVTLSMDTADKVSKNTVDTIKDNMTILQNGLTNQIALNKADADMKAEAYKNAWLKFKELGYVDNEISTLTGLAVGTRTKEVEAEIMKRYDEARNKSIELADELTKKEFQNKLDIEKVDATNKDKRAEEERKTRAAKIYASLGNMSATDALDEVSKNFGDLSDYMGSELWTLVDKLNAQKVIESNSAIDRQQLDLQRRGVVVSERNATTSEKNAAISAEKKATELSASEKNQYISQNASTYKSYPTTKAMELLLSDADQLISDVGPTGYKQIWDSALGESVNRGDLGAKLFNDYFKAPKKETTSSKLDKLANEIMSKYNIEISE